MMNWHSLSATLCICAMVSEDDEGLSCASLHISGHLSLMSTISLSCTALLGGLMRTRLSSTSSALATCLLYSRCVRRRHSMAKALG